MYKDRALPRSTWFSIRGIRPEGRRSQVEPRPTFTRVERLRPVGEELNRGAYRAEKLDTCKQATGLGSL